MSEYHLCWISLTAAAGPAEQVHTGEKEKEKKLLALS
jgi:hypothetical protein